MKYTNKEKKNIYDHTVAVYPSAKKSKLQQKILRPKSLENNNQLICHRYINLNKKAFAESLK